MAPRKPRVPNDTSTIENIRLKDVDDQPVRLATLWMDGPAVLVWLRHYG